MCLSGQVKEQNGDSHERSGRESRKKKGKEALASGKSSGPHKEDWTRMSM